ncbi:MAG: peptidoglycan DD-metalloendopeptidase family protein, partial [Methylotenera sp.]|nr:peptidoglycan DD-metalloendopeptidase family protein [Methylotenera sp.]
DEAFKKPLPVAKPENEKIISVTKAVATSTPSASTTKPGSEIKPEIKADPKPDVKPNIETSNSTEWAWPTKGKVIANFNDAGNKGIDIAGTMGQSINAAAAGKVIYSGSDLRGYGKLVIIKHNATYLSVYAHNNLIVVKEGQVVTRGQKIAEMGNTDSNTIKLHFEIRQQGKSVDPNKFLTSN